MVLLDVKYHNVTPQRALRACVSLAGQNRKTQISFLNLDSLYKAADDARYREALASSDLVLPDGVGIKIATRLFGGRMKGNCNGTDFSPRLMERLSQAGHKIYLLGGKPGVAEKAAEALKTKIPGIRIAGTHCGYFNTDRVIRDINASGATVLFAGLGAPLQEKWILENRDKLEARMCLGVGALLDWISGEHARSPLLLRRLNLEWSWRILVEPRRMFKRYFVDDLPFLLNLFYARMKMR